VGCGQYWGESCANDALTMNNGSGFGAGMQACGRPCPDCPQTQQWNYSGANSKILQRADGSCLEVFPIAHDSVESAVVVQPYSKCSINNGGQAVNPEQQWEVVGPATPGPGGIAYVQLQSAVRGSDGRDVCLAVGSSTVSYAMDPWCTSNNNMWRTSTDTLQVWGRVMVQIDSLVGLGDVSGPGHWGFADSLELGVPGYGVLTWEESKTHLAMCV
jgi:hypothetical protein